MFNVGLIDSLKVRIKKDNIKILDKRIVEDFIAYYPTIEALDDDGNPNERLGFDYRKAEPFVKIIDGITYRFFFKAFINKRKIAEEYLVLQISAKMVKQNYFDGITLKNIKQVLNDINSFKIIYLDIQTLLDGLVSDIDICINQLIDEKSLKGAFSLIKQFPNKGKEPLMHFISQSHHIKGLVNLGVDFNKREKANPTTPYCKIYHKGIELQRKSSTFFNSFLSHNQSITRLLPNLVRYEFTIKANKHKLYLRKNELLFSELKTLKDLLTTSSAELTNIAKSGLKHYIDVPVTKRNKIDDLKPTEIVLKYYIETIINLGGSSDKLLGFQYDIKCPVQRSRTKTAIKNIIDKTLNNDEKNKAKLKANEQGSIFLKNLGLDGF